MRPDDLPAYIAQRVLVDPVTGCWRWQRRTDKNGYGLVNWQKKTYRLHRLTYTMLVGPIPDGLTIDHVKDRGCRYRDCCYPAHMEPVTHRVNILRGDGLAAVNAVKTHCDHDHEYTEANTYHHPDGSRGCRKCRRVMAGYQGKPRHGTETACPQDHEYTPANTYVDRKGRRNCRECNRQRLRALREVAP